jgi:hypothetical protein
MTVTRTGWFPRCVLTYRDWLRFAKPAESREKYRENRQCLIRCEVAAQEIFASYFKYLCKYTCESSQKEQGIFGPRTGNFSARIREIVGQEQGFCPTLTRKG